MTTPRIEKIVESILNHKAMKFSNDAIVLQALRSGTKGYTGASFPDFLAHTLTQLESSAVEKLKEKICEVIVQTDWEHDSNSGINRLVELTKPLTHNK